MRSRNIPAVALSNRLTGGGLYQFLQASGAQLPHPPGHYGLALTLGGFGISPETVASLYAALADDDIPKPLVFSNKKSPPLLGMMRRIMIGRYYAWKGGQKSQRQSTLKGKRPKIDPLA